MFFVQVLDPDLGCAAYVLGDAGAAVAVDPGLDTGRLIAAAAAHGAVITTIAETHVHADHVSGRALLAGATGAAVRVPPAPASTPRPAGHCGPATCSRPAPCGSRRSPPPGIVPSISRCS